MPLGRIYEPCTWYDPIMQITKMIIDIKPPADCCQYGLCCRVGICGKCDEVIFQIYNKQIMNLL